MSKELHKILDQTTCPSSEALKLYAEGELDAANAHAIEMHIIDCEICADELEGIMELVKEGNFEHLVKEINQDIDTKVGEEKKILPFMNRWMKFAALIIVFLGLGYLIDQFAFFDAHETSQVAEVSDEKSPNDLEKTKHKTFPEKNEELESPQSRKGGSAAPEANESIATETKEMEIDEAIVFEEQLNGQGAAAIAKEKKEFVFEEREVAYAADDADIEAKKELDAKDEIAALDGQVQATKQPENKPGVNNKEDLKDIERDKSDVQDIPAETDIDQLEQEPIKKSNDLALEKEKRGYKTRKKSLFSKIVRSKNKKKCCPACQDGRNICCTSRNNCRKCKAVVSTRTLF